MTVDKKKKMVAALSGVIQYLEEEKQIVSNNQPMQATRNNFSVWASYGRQHTMSNGQLMQRRLIRR